MSGKDQNTNQEEENHPPFHKHPDTCKEGTK